MPRGSHAGRDLRVGLQYSKQEAGRGPELGRPRWGLTCLDLHVESLPSLL